MRSRLLGAAAALATGTASIALLAAPAHAAGTVQIFPANSLGLPGTVLSVGSEQKFELRATGLEPKFLVAIRSGSATGVELNGFMDTGDRGEIHLDGGSAPEHYENGHRGSFHVVDQFENTSLASVEYTVQRLPKAEVTAPVVAGAEATVLLSGNVGTAPTVDRVQIGARVLGEPTVKRTAAGQQVTFTVPGDVAPGRATVALVQSTPWQRVVDVPVTVASAPVVAPRLSATAVKVEFGRATSVPVRVAGADAGTVRAQVAGKVYSAPVTAGRASVKVPARSLPVGTHRVSLVLAAPGAGEVHAATSVQVRKAGSRVRVSAPRTARPGKKVTLRIKVTPSVAGVPVAGTVRVNAWGRIQQVRVKGGAGTVVVKVPAKATGKATLTVRWLGSASVTSSSVKQVVQVKRR